MGGLPINPNTRRVFEWERLDIEEGRISLGNEMPVLVYRMMQFSMFDVIAKDLGAEDAKEIFRKAGHLAGLEYTRNVLDLDVSFDIFISALQKSLVGLRIGVLNMEEFNAKTGKIILTLAEDLDCSGLPVTNETVCHYDEGFIAGILESYTGKKYKVREVDCWSNGDRVCRFHATVED